MGDLEVLGGMENVGDVYTGEGTAVGVETLQEAAGQHTELYI